MFATISSVGKSSVASSKWIVGPIHTRVIGSNGFINASPDTSAIRCAPRIISCRVLSLTGIGTMKILFSRAHCMTRPRRRLLSTSGTTPASYACAMLLRVSAAQSVIVLRSPQTSSAGVPYSRGALTRRGMFRVHSAPRHGAGSASRYRDGKFAAFCFSSALAISSGPISVAVRSSRFFSMGTGASEHPGRSFVPIPPRMS